MGMRLVISIETKGEPIAKLYFHWSAYTTSALYETQRVVDCIYNHKDETIKELQLRLIRFCEESGGGIDGNKEEQEYIQAMFPNEKFLTDGYSRSRGLIALSEKGMDDMQGWSEGDVIIDLDEDIINFGVYCCYDDLDEYVENRKDWDDEFEGIDLEDIPDIGYDLGWIEVSEINNVIDAVGAICDGLARYGNEIYELTE